MLQYGWELSGYSGKQFDLVDMPNVSPVSQRQAHLEVIRDEGGAVISSWYSDFWSVWFVPAFGATLRFGSLWWRFNSRPCGCLCECGDTPILSSGEYHSTLVLVSSAPGQMQALDLHYRLQKSIARSLRHELLRELFVL